MYVIVQSNDSPRSLVSITEPSHSIGQFCIILLHFCFRSFAFAILGERGVWYSTILCRVCIDGLGKRKVCT